MFENDKEPTVLELIKAAESEKIFLPEFQREFVWDNSQIKLLIDSLYNNYTINSILSWEGTDELARRRVGGSINEIKIPEQKNIKVNYLLDGQQRTTSLLLVFTNKKVFKRKKIRKCELINLYFDSEYIGDDPELRLLFDFEIIMVNNQEISLDKFTEKELFEKFGTRFIHLKNVYKDAIDSNYFNRLEQEFNDPNNAMNYYKKIRDLRDKILNKRVININQPGDLSAVLSIFSRINTLNTKLNIFDIMVAKTYKKIEGKYFDLRTYLKIINCEESIKEDYFETIEKCNIDKSQEFALDEEDQLFLILIILKKEFRQKEILDITTDDLLANMKNIHITYWQVIRLLDNEFKLKKDNLGGIRPLVKFLTAYISENPSLTVEKRNFLKIWFWNTLLHNRYPGSQNEKIKNDYDFCKENNLTKCVEYSKKERSRHFNEKNLGAYYGERSQLRDALSILFKFSECKELITHL